MSRKLYMIWGSPPVNAVLMAARALNVDLELHKVDFEKQEFMQEWFLELNPSHTVPTLDDNGYIIWDSHAILVYLAETYGKDGNLYSSETKTRFQILQILNLDCGTIFRRVSDCIRPLFYENEKTINPKHLEYLKDAYTILDRILKSSKFLASDQLTVADISVFSSVIVANMFLPIDQEVLPNLKRWLTEVQGLELTKAAQRGIEAIKRALQAKLGSSLGLIEPV